MQTKRRELVSEERELARVAAEVKESQAKAEACLSEAQTISSRLQEARDQARPLKHTLRVHATQVTPHVHTHVNTHVNTHATRTRYDLTGAAAQADAHVAPTGGARLVKAARARTLGARTAPRRDCGEIAPRLGLSRSHDLLGAGVALPCPSRVVACFHSPRSSHDRDPVPTP